jgi:CheY-like chemotaxis protein
MLMSKRSAEVVTADDGVTALKAMDGCDYDFDLVFMDNTMPNMVSE